jgi:pimeloyl-ACP methyl ester carboxylesterase
MPSVRLVDTTIHYLDRGHGPAVVVLLHAFPMHAGMWRPQIEVLSRRFRVIAPDVRGFGASGEPPVVLPISTIAEDVWHLLDTLGISKVVVCGLSLGGYVAFELYRRAPEVFGGLVLADTRATADTPEGREGREAIAQAAHARGMTWVADDSIPKLLRAGHDPAVGAEVRRIILDGTPAAVAAVQRGMALRADSTATLATIEVPTLVLVGGQDAVTPPSVVEPMAKAIPGATMQILEGAGHLANLDAPDAFTAAIERFVAAHPHCHSRAGS